MRRKLCKGEGRDGATCCCQRRSLVRRRGNRFQRICAREPLRRIRESKWGNENENKARWVGCSVRLESLLCPLTSLQTCGWEATTTAPVIGKTWRPTRLIGNVLLPAGREEAPAMAAGPGKKPKLLATVMPGFIVVQGATTRSGTRSDVPFIRRDQLCCLQEETVLTWARSLLCR